MALWSGIAGGPAEMMCISGGSALSLNVLLGLLPSPLMHYVLAAIGAVLVLWFWRGR
jgi:hypothetical protein